MGFVHFIAPNTADERIHNLESHITGYFYVLSGFGVTGVKAAVDPRTIERVQHIRKLTSKPLVVGFGISQPEHVGSIWQAGANAAIVGSKFSSLIEQNLNQPQQAEQAIVDFIQAVNQL